MAALEAVRRQEAQWAEATGGVEAKIAQWDFAGALAVLDKLEPSDPALRERLTRRRDEVRRMAEMKGRIIGDLNAANPRPKALDLGVKVLAAEVTGADESGVTVVRRVGTNVDTRQVAWSEIGPDAPGKLLQRVVDRQSAEDWLSAACLAQACGLTDLAGRLLAQARSMGADTAPFELSQAAAALSRAIAMLDTAQGQLKTREAAELELAREGFVEAESLLRGLESATPNAARPAHWGPAVEGGLKLAHRGPREVDAEELFARALELHEKRELFDLRDVVERLKAEYADTSPVTDTARSPSFAEMEKAVANLGRLITVRQDGQGDFRVLQEAIKAAPPKSVIEIQDGAVYNEQLIIPEQAEGLTIRSKKGTWATITSRGQTTGFGKLLIVEAAGVTLDRLFIDHGGSDTTRHHDCGAVYAVAPGFRAHSLIIYFPNASGRKYSICAYGGGDLENCVLVGAVSSGGTLVLKNSVCVRDGVGCKGKLEAHNVFAQKVLASGPAELRFCTVPGDVTLKGASSSIQDSIVSQVESPQGDTRIEHCDVFGGNYLLLAKPGEGCFSKDPQFRDPKVLDYRLAPGSPCIGKASDGGDIGVRWTPEMLEMIKIALELRARGLIKF